MKSTVEALINLRFLFASSQNLLYFPKTLISKTRTHSTIAAVTSLNGTLGEIVTDNVRNNPTDVFIRWGCSPTDISKIYHRRPSLHSADTDHLKSKLNLLGELGLTSSDLVKVINCRPRFFSYRINHCFDERLEFLMKLFGTRELLIKAIVRNPSLLTYDLHNRVKPVVALYEELGVSGKDLISMLISRPTLIPRTSFNEDKMEYIRKTGTSPNNKMYKYVVTLIAISCLRTIREKVANFEKFGFSEDEILDLFGRSPLVLTLSIDKVQRNMTFVIGTLKLQASVVLKYPFLLFYNLESWLKPRAFLAGKIQQMGLDPQIKGPSLLRALRMKEDRFLRAFVKCHPNYISNELMEYYTEAKGLKRLAETSKKNINRGFPF